MKKSVVIIMHIIYWVMNLWIILIIDKLINENPGFRSWTWFNIFVSSWIIPGLLGFYSSYWFLFPRFLKRKKIRGFFLIGLLVCIMSAFIQEIYLSIMPGPGIFAEQWSSAIGVTWILSLIALIHGIMGLVLRGFISWYRDIKLKEDLNKKNYEMELELIKSQINPHFLFNTINNIDVLIEKDAAKASSYLNKLSDIMRFMLYETKTEKITLEKELTYIEKYIDLQKIRTTNTNYVNYAVVGDSTNLMIAPMLFIPFIENAFKHTENKKVENAINIKVTVEKELIIFECENKYSENNQTKLEQSGLGNELIRKRLALLYPDKHTLKVTDTDGTYKVKLTLL
jgi:two-component system LytT family sensor kinase